MSKVIAIMSMSLDGFVADHNGGVAQVMGWYFNSGDTEIRTAGRRTFETAHGWGGNHAWGPAFVLTHRIPAGWPRPNSTVHFVTDGIEGAVKQAKAAAGGKSDSHRWRRRNPPTLPSTQEVGITTGFPTLLRDEA